MCPSWEGTTSSVRRTWPLPVADPNLNPCEHVITSWQLRAEEVAVGVWIPLACDSGTRPSEVVDLWGSTSDPTCSVVSFKFNAHAACRAGVQYCACL